MAGEEKRPDAPGQVGAATDVAAPAADSPIRCRGLTMIYRTDILRKKRKALDSLDLDIQRGEVFGYLGANGAGKTTTIKLLVGLLQPTAGEAWVLGRPVDDVASRRGVGFLPENPYFYDYLTAREAVEFYATLSGLPRAERAKRTGEVLELVGLAAAEGVRIGGFSKGMRQRLGLAQALVHEPELLILDEPMSGLDPVGRRDVREIILAQRDSGRTIFFSSHILSDVEAICDRVGIIAGGKLVEAGPLDSILTTEITAIDVTVAGVSRDQFPAVAASRVLETDKGLQLTVSDYDAAYRIVDLARAAGGNLLALTPRGESLEEYFMRTQSSKGRSADEGGPPA